MADQLSLIEPGTAQARPAGRLSIAHQVVINALAAILTPPMLEHEMRQLFLMELADALDQVRLVDAPGPVAQLVQAGSALVDAWRAPAATPTVEARMAAIRSAEWQARGALGSFFYWRLAGASDALKNGAANAH